MLKKKDKKKTINLISVTEVKEEKKPAERKEEEDEEYEEMKLAEKKEEEAPSTSSSMVTMDNHSQIPDYHQQNPCFNTNEERMTMFSDENPNACSMM